MPELPPLEEITEGREAREADEPTAEVDLGGGRKLRLNLPQLPQWIWGLIALFAGSSGTFVGSLLEYDWLGLRAQRELAAAQCDLELALCGCEVDR